MYSDWDGQKIYKGERTQTRPQEETASVDHICPKSKGGMNENRNACLVSQRFDNEREEKKNIPTNLPFIVVVADEIADLMMTSGKEVEQHIIRLAQKSRAVGIHLILATQKPTVDVISPPIAGPKIAETPQTAEKRPWIRARWEGVDLASEPVAETRI